MTNTSRRSRNDIQLGGTIWKETEGLTRECRERSGGELKRKRSRYVSSAGSPANRSTVGAAGRRRQFRADRRCNHPRPCPLLLSGPSGGLFSLPPYCTALRQSPRLFLRAHRHSRRAHSTPAGGGNGAKSPGGHRPDPSGRELRDRENAYRSRSVAFGPLSATRQTSLLAASAYTSTFIACPPDHFTTCDACLLDP